MKEAAGIAAMISNRCASLTLPILTQQLRISPVARISEPLCRALCNLALDKPEEVGKDLRKAVNLIKQACEDGLISEDYVQGLGHLLNDLGTQEFDNHRQDDIWEPISEPFQDLSQSARAVIMGVHAFFAGCRRQTEMEIELLQCINKVDPENIEWPLRLHIALRTFRNDKSFRGEPCPEEKEALLRAIHLNQNHISVKLQICMYLSDVIRFRSLEPPRSMVLVLEGYLELYSLQAAVEHIKNMCNEILITEEGSNWLIANLTIADIIGFSFPFKYRDNELALKCFRNALKINPKSSKANHKMGILLLSNAGESEKALRYIRKAFENNHTNVAALIDIIQILLSRLEENSSELETLFEKYVVKNGKELPAFRLVSLLFTKGIYHFMKAEKEVALQTWMEVYKADPKSLKLHFKQLPHSCSRYNWDPRRLSLKNILDSLETVRKDRRELHLRLETDDEYIISLLIALVKEVQEKPNSNQGEGDGNVKRQGTPSYASRAQKCISDSVDNWRSGEETWESNSSWRNSCYTNSDPVARRDGGRSSNLSGWGAIGEKSWRDNDQ